MTPLFIVMTSLMTLWVSCDAEFTMTLMHTNDIHARFEQFTKFGSQCSTKNSEEGNCFGGYARLKSAVESVREQYNNTLLVDEGDQFQGTLYFYAHTGNITSSFMNWVQYDAMRYNNTLLEDGGEQFQGTLYFYAHTGNITSFFMNWVQYDAMGTLYFYAHTGNITSFFMNWVQYDAMAIGNHEFDRGVEGLVPFLQKTQFAVVSANMDVTNEPSLHSLVNRSTVVMVGSHRVGIVGYTTEETPQISRSGNMTFKDVVTSVEQEVQRLRSQGVKVIIAVGHAGFTVDQQVANIPGVSVVIGGHSNTFLYTGDPPSNEVPAGPYPTEVVRADGTRSVAAQCFTWAKYLCVLHLTFSDSDGQLLRYHGNPQLLNSSVPQGNLIADAVIGQNKDHPDEAMWADVNIALVNSGGIRYTIPIGIQVTYNINRAAMNRVVSLKALVNVTGGNSVYQPVEDEKDYKIMVTNYLAQGGDGYSMLADHAVNVYPIGDVDADMIVEYITKTTTPLSPGLEGRITFIDNSDVCKNGTTTT
ncbi:hypothetical protein ACOMHN_055045 [Nucella lapillus]